MRWFSRKKAPADSRHVRFYTRDGCHLCDDAFVVLEKYAVEYGLVIEIINISANDALEGEFGEQIPVVFIDDKKRFFGKVDPVLLLRILNRPSPKGE